MRKIIYIYIRASLILRISIGLVLGVLVGLLIGQQAAAVLAPFGELLLRLLKFLIIPLVLFTVIVGINQADIARIGRVGRKIFAYYITTTALAIVVGLAVATLFQPGEGLAMNRGAHFNVPENPGITQVILNIVPANIVAAFSKLNLLGIIFTAIVFGIAILKMRRGEKYRVLGEHVYTVFAGLNEATMIIMRGVLHYVPIGIFAIVAHTVALQGAKTILALGGMVAVLYIALLVHLIIYVLLQLVFKLHPGVFFRCARAPMITAFATQSSAGTLPLSLDAADRLGLPQGVYGFTLPLGATINMDGAAIRIAISAVFAANVAGIALRFSSMAEIVLIGTLASIGTAGVPGAGIIMIATVFAQVGLPIETVALLTSIDALVGMGCTALNVTGDLVGASIVAQTEGKHEHAGADCNRDLEL